MLLTNAQLVLENEVIYGTLQVENGVIQEISEGAVQLPGAIDCEGDYILPGLVELHTDNMDKHFSPRPGVDWPADPAFHTHDAQMVSAGITTVFDAVSIGDVVEKSARLRNLKRMVEAINEYRDSARAHHVLHLRCEVSHKDTLDRFEHLIETPNVQLVSIMDHSPGQRQFVRLDKYREYYQGKYGLSDQELEEFIARQQAGSAKYSDAYRKAICNICNDRNIAIASHDDATAAHVDEAIAMGMAIAEFPTTEEAADLSHKSGLGVLMGAPNVVRGGSHSGNVAAHLLAAQNKLDILSSDYIPSSLLWSAFILADREDNILDLPQTVQMVTSNPARAAGLNDRGLLASGLRADLVRVRRDRETPRVITVFGQGERVY